MTSTPASRSALATTLAPRSWPSRPGFAMTTRMLMNSSYPQRSPGTSRGGSELSPGTSRGDSELLDRGVTQDQVLDPVIPAEIDLGFGIVAAPFDRQHPAEPVGVMIHVVARRQRGNRPGAGRVHPRPPRQPLRGRRRGCALVPPPLHQPGRYLGQEPGLLVIGRPAPPGPRHRPGEVQPLLRPGDPDVREPPLLLQLPLIADRALVRED